MQECGALDGVSNPEIVLCNDSIHALGGETVVDLEQINPLFRGDAVNGFRHEVRHQRVEILFFPKFAELVVLGTDWIDSDSLVFKRGLPTRIASTNKRNLVTVLHQELCPSKARGNHTAKHLRVARFDELDNMHGNRIPQRTDCRARRFCEV